MNKLSDVVRNLPMPATAKAAIIKVSKCKCGEDLLIDNNLIGMYCSDPNCKIKLARRYEKMFKVLGVRDFGEANCEALVLENDLQYMHQAFILDENQMPSKYGIDMRVKLVENLISDATLTQPLYKVLAAMKLPLMDRCTKDLVANYSDMTKFYQDLFNEEKYGCEYVNSRRVTTPQQFAEAERFIAKQLGTSTGVKSRVITNNFLDNELDIRTMCKLFTIPVMKENVIRLAITNSISYGTKEEYVKMLNKILANTSTEVLLIEKFSKKANLKFLISQNVQGSSGQIKSAHDAKQEDKIVSPELVVNYCKNYAMNESLGLNLSDKELMTNVYDLGDLLREGVYNTEQHRKVLF